MLPNTEKNTMTLVDRKNGDSLEACEECLGKTPHQVSIEIRTESTKPKTAKFSREPYRITTCLMCGKQTSQRMNDA
jgi:hypothetical protein